MNRFGLGLLCTLALACSGGTPSNLSDGGDCGSVTLTHLTGLTNPHVATCTDAACGNGSNPPVGGPHCPTPLACGTFDTAQLPCQWIHNLEHGHLVLLYHCDQACPDVVTELQVIADQVTQGSNGVRRVLITPDPDLPTKVGSVVWGWSWTGDTVDAAAIACLRAHQDEDAPEAHLDCAAP